MILLFEWSATVQRQPYLNPKIGARAFRHHGHLTEGRLVVKLLI